MKRNNVLLVGYYGMNNCGDDILMQTCLEKIQSDLNPGVIRVTCSNHYPVSGDVPYQGILAKKQRFRGENRLRQYSAALRSDIVIFGGGSVLHTTRDIDQKIHLMKLAGHGPHGAMGVGIGPFTDSHAEQACAKFLNHCDFVGVRDDLSLDIAKGIAPRANCHKTFDLAPLLMDSMPLSHSAEKKGKKKIGISLCPNIGLVADDEQHQLKRVKVIADVLNQLAKEHDIEVYPIDMNGHPTLGDHEIHKKLLNLLEQHVAVHHIGYTHDSRVIINAIQDMDCILSMRLHGSILAYVMETPVISISYHPKCDQWCKDIGMSNTQQMKTDTLNVEDLFSVLNDGLSNGFTKPDLERELAFQKSQQNWSLYHACA